METNIKFPDNPFEDVLPSQFNKLNKKEVTEDFVAENFKLLGWQVFKPFTDTGIDRIIVKYVCPNGHTKLNGNLLEPKCKECGRDRIEIFRFLQVKTRNLKNDIFGFTLKSKDIRSDPRHIYVLYSDKTTSQKQDFLIISIKDLLSFFRDNHINPFASTSFRKGNNKLNSLRFEEYHDKWFWGRHNWEKFRNIKGLRKIQDPEVDLNLRKELISTRQSSNELLNNFSKSGRSYTDETVVKVNKALKEKMVKYAEPKEILKIRNNAKKYLMVHCNRDTLESSRKYFDNIRLSEIIGESDTENEE